MNAVAETAFTELDASRLYARLVNDLDPEPFIARLAPNVHYCSHWVIEDLDDSESVAKLLRGKVDTIRRTGNAQNDAIIGVATGYCRGMPLVVLMDKASEIPEATVSFEVTSGLITHIWICVLGAYSPAKLDDPDNYVWPPDEKGVDEVAKPAPGPREPDPDPAQIIATFADVTSDHHAPIDAAMVAAGHHRIWGNIDIALVPHDDPRIAPCDWKGVADARDAARDGDRLLFLLSWVKTGEALGIVTIPRPATPWVHVDLKEMKWLMRKGMPFDFNVYCELQIFGISGLMSRVAPIIMRPKPDMPLDELERRYLDLERTPQTYWNIDSMYDLASWPRFLATGANAAWSFAANGQLQRLHDKGKDSSLAVLVMEAWRKVADDAAEGRLNR